MIIEVSESESDEAVVCIIVDIAGAVGSRSALTGPP